MAQGLQVWDSSGDLQLDVTNRITTFIGSYTITEASPNLTITNNLFLTNTGFFAKPYTTAASFANMYSNQNIEKQIGNTYTLEFKNLPNGASFTIYVGVY